MPRLRNRSFAFVLLASLALPGASLAQGSGGGSTPATSPIYFGDLHVHTKLSLDAALAGTFEGPGFACQYARDVSGLDFVGISDHGEFIDQSEWQTAYIPIVNSFNDELDASVDGTGRFVTLLGYEWTSLNHGHKNVFFRTAAVPARCWDSSNRFQLRDTSTPSKLWINLKVWRAFTRNGADFLTIPHTVASDRLQTSYDWSFADRDAQPVVEVFSKHGNSEGDPSYQPVDGFNPLTTYQAALNMWLQAREPGYQMGAIGSSDTHDAKPSGEAPSPDQLNVGRRLNGGWVATGALVAVHATELTRANVFDALKARRCYGTSGPRIRLWLHVETDRSGPQPMGSEVSYSQTVRLKIRAVGDSAPVSAVQILRGAPGLADPLRSDLVATLAVTNGVEVVWEDPAPASHAYYYVIALQDPTTDYTKLGPFRRKAEVQLRERAWSSPVWVVQEGS